MMAKRLRDHFLLFRYGRRVSFFSLLFMSVGLAIITSFSPNYVVFTVLRTINGFTFPALFQIPFIISETVMHLLFDIDLGH